jgi:SAM-dependent methyltransferase
MKKNSITGKGLIQEKEYIFPYHYIPRFEGGIFAQYMNLNWGFEYLSSMEFIIDLLKEVPFESLIDVGCGDGRFCAEAAKRFPGRRICGVDISERAVSLARALNPELEFIRGDISDVSSLQDKTYKNGFDLAVSIEVLEHIKPEEADRFLKNMAAFLKSGGKLLLTVPSVNSPLQEKHYRHFDYAAIEKLLQPYFKIEDVSYINRISLRVTLIRKFFTNRFFIVNSQFFRKMLYRRYCKKHLSAHSRNCKRLVILAGKK